MSKVYKLTNRLPQVGKHVKICWDHDNLGRKIWKKELVVESTNSEFRVSSDQGCLFNQGNEGFYWRHFTKELPKIGDSIEVLWYGDWKTRVVNKVVNSRLFLKGINPFGFTPEQEDIIWRRIKK